MTYTEMKPFLIDSMHRQGIPVSFFRQPYHDFSRFDMGLHHLVNRSNDYDSILQLLTSGEKNVLFRMYDPFYLRAYFFTLPLQENGTTVREICCVGPFVARADEVSAKKVAEKNHLSDTLIPALEEYYSSIPAVYSTSAIAAQVSSLFRYSGGFSRIVLDDSMAMDAYYELSAPVSTSAELYSSAALIEERYRQEDVFLDAVCRGDYTAALQALHMLSRYHIPNRSTTLRERKNALIIQNTLLRKSVQKANVPPFRIHEISGSIAKRIEAADTEKELYKLSFDMVRKYCLLVQNCATGAYTQVISDALRYIDSHLAEPITLVSLAAQVNVSTSYLSARFKREVGQTLTEYINHKRLENCQILLSKTDLPIQEIAARVGILDENYFSRLFRKQYKMTPREYRIAMRR